MLAAHNCKSDSRGNTAGADFQDKKYGKGMRIWTETKEKTKKHCTVCGNK